MSGPDSVRDDPDACLLAFSLGPVQPFIAAARSVRDLWTGSYLLSWLTRQAMQPIVVQHGRRTLLMPALEDDPPVNPDRPPPASVPNRFLALVPGGVRGDAARELAAACEARCRQAWEEVCEAVRAGLGERASGLDPNWDRRWHAQVGDYFEIRTAVLPFGSCDEPTLARLLDSSYDARRVHALWWGRLQLVARLMAAQRAGGHQPAYRASGDVPQKCSLLGTYEQMGPAGLAESKQFWEDLSERCEWKGTRLRPDERLCAISLVKRYAWPAFLSSQLGYETRAAYFTDTATVAAAEWLCQAPEIDPRQERKRPDGDWSGQWLHWSRREGPRGRDARDRDHDRSPDEKLWARIVAKRAGQGLPPAYLAILILDGDRMGEWLRGDKTPNADPRDLTSAISRVLARFSAGAAREIVEDRHYGTLIYSGGDDVLAFLPTRTALACARELNESFTAAWGQQMGRFGDKPVTVSAGLAVVHHKEDLRFALDQARRAETLAKDSGRNALTLRICRRSGEHTSVVVPWTLVRRLEGWVEHFRGDVGTPAVSGASDRWLYALRAELPTLQGPGVPWEAAEAEVRRLAGRAEDEGRRIDPDEAVDLLRAYRDAMRTRREAPPSASLEGFATLGQAASFLARGRD